MARTGRFVLLSILIIAIQITIFWINDAHKAQSGPEIPFLQKSKLFQDLFFHPIVTIIAEVIGTLILFTGMFLINAPTWNVFFLMVLRFIFQGYKLDPVNAMTNLIFGLTTITTYMMPNGESAAILIAILGAACAFCVGMAVEFFPVALFAFFAILFFWLRNHTIGNDDASAAPDAMKTVVVFMIFFGNAIWSLSHRFGKPQMSDEFWSAIETRNVFPILNSRLAFACIPSFFYHHEGRKALLAMTGVLCSQFFRFIPLATKGAGFTLCSAVSAKLFDFAAITFISSAPEKQARVFCVLLAASIYLAIYFVNL